jgi:6-phosphogluconolactonase
VRGRRLLAAKTGGLSAAPPSVHNCKGIIMLRSIGSLTFMALLMVGCGGSGGGSNSGPPPPSTFSVGGTVTGLSGTGLVLNSDFGGDLPISASGSFAFSTRLPDGGTFNVSVKDQPTSSPAQSCQVVHGTGTIAAANVTNVDVTCVSGYTVGGTVSGLVGSGLTLAICSPVPYPSQHGPGCPIHDELRIGADGAFTLHSDSLPGYPGFYDYDTIIITHQPSSPTQRCVISNAKVTLQNANDNSVTVSCATFSYVTNAADNTLSAYNVDANTGALAVLGTPTATGVSPHAIRGVDYGEGKRFVFVGNEGSNDLSAFAVNPATGALTALPGSPFAAGTDPQAMTFDGSSLYVANAGSDNVYVYNIDVNTGTLARPSTFATGKNPTSIVLGGSNSDFFYVANHGGSNDISAFRYQDLMPVSGSPFPAGGSPLSLAFGAGGKFLYSANPDVTNPSISGFSIDPISGVLVPLSGSPFPLPVSHYMDTDQTGAYLYVTSGADVIGYSIDANTGALTALAGFPVTVGVDAYSITVDPTNQFLYVTDDGAAHVSGFRLDASTGALSPMAGSPFPAGQHPEFIATF